VEVFDPVLLSVEENQFLIDHAGEAPQVALHHGVPRNVNANAVRPVLQVIYDLEELKRHRGQEWVGVEAVKAAAKVYLREYEKELDLRRRGAPTHPTMYLWDAKGKAHRGGVGSDAGHVRTYFDENGDRKRYAIELIGDAAPTFKAPWTKAAEPLPQDVIEDQEKGFFRCPLCEFTVNYDAGVQTQRNIARAKMATHLKSSKKDPDRHRELHGVVFGA